MASALRRFYARSSTGRLLFRLPARSPTYAGGRQRSFPGLGRTSCITRFPMRSPGGATSATSDFRGLADAQASFLNAGAAEKPCVESVLAAVDGTPNSWQPRRTMQSSKPYMLGPGKGRFIDLGDFSMSVKATESDTGGLVSVLEAE